MSNTTLEQVERLASQLSPADLHLLIHNLLQRTDQNALGYRPRVNRSKEEVRLCLAQAWGAWGSGKTADEIDREVKAMRARDWDRDWHSG